MYPGSRKVSKKNLFLKWNFPKKLGPLKVDFFVFSIFDDFELSIFDQLWMISKLFYDVLKELLGNFEKFLEIFEVFFSFLKKENQKFWKFSKKK